MLIRIFIRDSLKRERRKEKESIILVKDLFLMVFGIMTLRYKDS